MRRTHFACLLGLLSHVGTAAASNDTRQAGTFARHILTGRAEAYRGGADGMSFSRGDLVARQHEDGTVTVETRHDTGITRRTFGPAGQTRSAWERWQSGRRAFIRHQMLPLGDPSPVPIGQQPVLFERGGQPSRP